MSFKCINKRKPKHKKTHRAPLTNLNILYANVRGIKGKAHDLEHKLKMHETHISALTETKLGSIPPKIEGYTWITKNKHSGTGGIALMVKNKLANITKTPEFLEDDDTEILWCELETKPVPTYIGVVYGKQESAPIEEVERQFQTITTHILTLKQKGKIILTGDFNAKLNIQKTNYDNSTVTQSKSRNGKLLEKMLEETNCVAVSTNSKVGLWTRVNTKNENERSIIDYIIVPEEDVKHVTNIEVDEQEVFKITGENKSDHNTITMSINTETQTKEKNQSTGWKVDNKEGWIAFNKKIEEIDTENKIENYEDLQNTLIKTLQETIGKKRNGGKNKPKSEELKKAQTERLQKRKDFKNATKSKTNNIKEKLHQYIQAQINVKKIIEIEERDELEKKFQQFIHEGGIKSQSFWKTRRSILQKDTIE